MPTPIQQAIALHQQGHLPQAEALYLQTLQTEPANFDALHLLGVIRLGQGALDAAHDLIAKALETNAGHATAHFNFGNLLRRMGQPEAALASYRRALALRPGFVSALTNCGATLRDLKRPAEALACYQSGLAQAQTAAETAELLFCCGNALQDLGEWEPSLAHYRQALAKAPQHAEAWGNQGALLRKMKRPDEALECYRTALSLRPRQAEILWHNIGNLLLEMRRPQEALDSYVEALRLNPAHLGAQAQSAVALLMLKRPQEALEASLQALRLEPGLPDALLNQGNALHFLGHNEQALELYAQVLLREPESVQARLNQAVVLLDLCRAERALAIYLEAQRIDPESVDAHWGESLCRLRMGDFGRGWEKYEWRWRTDPLDRAKRVYPQPLWLGAEPLQGKTVLLHAEQGFGDTLQFCRYAKLVRQMGARVLLEVPGQLKALLGDLDGLAAPDRVLGPGDTVPAFDTHCPLMSLPLAFQTRLGSIPASPAYIGCKPEWAQPWQARLGPKTRPRVGLVWSGSIIHAGDGNRSLPLSRLAPLCAAFGEVLDFVSLQKELRPEDRERLRGCPQIRHFGEELHDFTNTAGLVTQMDLVLSVDTSVAHLAGAMGKPLWLLLAAGPDWRWLEEREDSPWYPSARLFRQRKAGDWAGVLEEVGKALRSLA